MKIVLLVLVFCLLPLLVVAGSLAEASRKERLRRESLSTGSRNNRARTYTDADLEAYRRLRNSSAEPPRPAARPVTPSRDLTRERAHWQMEKENHDRELARLDAAIRKLDWRLGERKTKRRLSPRDDPALQVLQESLEALRHDRARLIERFQEKARKAGALPGWLR